MAKSIRSKRKRKMRAVKRAKNAPRELKKLQSILGINKDGIQDEEMKELITVTDAKKIEQDKQKQSVSTGMEVDSKYNRKTMKDDQGNYPEWMNQRQIRKKKAQLGKGKRKGKKKSLW